MGEYKHMTTDVERDRVKDILLTQEHLTEMYNSFSNDIICDSLHNEMMGILREEHDMQHKLYNELRKRGWYEDSKGASLEDVKSVYDEFNNMFEEIK